MVIVLSLQESENLVVNGFVIYNKKRKVSSRTCLERPPVYSGHVCWVPRERIMSIVDPVYKGQLAIVAMYFVSLKKKMCVVGPV